jgi:Putative transposase/Transposase zinc-binding domain
MLLSQATAAGVGTAPQRPRFEVADIVRAYGEAFRATHSVSHEQARVRRAIAQCRPAALGGHLEGGEACGTEPNSYNSCRNRHCPKCQGSARAKGLAAEQALRLPVPYFHLVFTLPPQLNPLVRVNQRALYTLLFQAATQTLRRFARDPNHLGAELGITAVLHTWGQTLTEHSHVQCLVTGGGLTADGTQWRPSHPRFLFAVQALSPVFPGKYLAGLRRLRHRQRLHFAGESAELAADAAWTTFLSQLQDRPWVVYAKPPWGGPEPGLKSLSRYTQRVASANSRPVFVGDGVVRFRYKDYTAGGTTQVLELPAEEFLRRFLLHVVPPRFVRIRHFGLVANRTCQEKLARCRQLLAVVAATATSLLPAPNGEPPAAGAETASPARCPACGGGPLRVIAVLAPHEAFPHDHPRPLPVSLRPPLTARDDTLGAARPRLLSACSPTLASPGGGTADRLPARLCLPQPLRPVSCGHLQPRPTDWQRPPDSLESP